MIAEKNISNYAVHISSSATSNSVFEKQSSIRPFQRNEMKFTNVLSEHFIKKVALKEFRIKGHKEDKETSCRLILL